MLFNAPLAPRIEDLALEPRELERADRFVQIVAPASWSGARTEAWLDWTDALARDFPADGDALAYDGPEEAILAGGPALYARRLAAWGLNQGVFGSPADARRKIGVEHVTIAYTNRGAWEPGATYDTNDLVWWEGTSYGAVVSHQAGEDFLADLIANSLWRAVGGDLAMRLAGAAGSELVGFQQAGDGAIARTLQGKVRESVSVNDFRSFCDEPGEIGRASCRERVWR